MSIYKAKVTVRKKPTVADPEGKTISEALARLGHTEIISVRSGKVFHLEIEADSEETARDKLNRVAEDILSNPVIENFELEIVGDR